MVAVGAVGLFGLTYGPLLWEFAGNLWSRPYYQHFPYVLLAAAVLIYEQLKTAPATSQTRDPWLQVTLLTTAWLVLVLAVVAMSPLLAAVSAILLTGGLLAAYCRHTGSRFPAAPWLLTWLIIPPPVGLDQRLLTRLQLISSDLASKALDLLGVGHLMQGNTLILPTKQLFVDEACSGIVSVISLSTCAAIYAVWQRRPLVHIALLMAAAVGWAVLLNVVRIVTIALAEAHAGVDLAEGFAHTLLGLGIFALNVLAVIALDWLLHAILSEINPSEAGDIHAAMADSPLQSGRQLIAFWNWLTTTNTSLFRRGKNQQGEKPAFPGVSNPPTNQPTALAPTLSWASLLAAAAFAALGLGQLVLPKYVAAGVATQKLPVDQIVAALLEPDIMPDKIDELTLVDVKHVERERDNINGEHSIVWRYEGSDGSPVLLSCDLPFTGGWHELGICYMGIGWEVEERGIVNVDEEMFQLVQLKLAKPDGTRALVLFECFDADGQAISPPHYWGTTRLARNAFFRRVDSLHHEFYQVQIKAESESMVEAAFRNAALSALRRLRREVRIRTHSASTPAEAIGRVH